LFNQPVFLSQNYTVLFSGASKLSAYFCGVLGCRLSDCSGGRSWSIRWFL